MEKKNTSLQQKKLPFRIKLLLDSTDVELVQMGANIMKDYIPKKNWEKTLEKFKYQDREDSLFIEKWTWKIEGNEITIIENTQRFVIDLWALRQKVTMPLFTLINSDSSSIQYIDSDKYTFQFPINGK